MWLTGFRKEYNKTHTAEERQFRLLNTDIALIRVPHQCKISLTFHPWIVSLGQPEPSSVKIVQMCGCSNLVLACGDWEKVASVLSLNTCWVYHTFMVFTPSLLSLTWLMRNPQCNVKAEFNCRKILRTDTP